MSHAVVTPSEEEENSPKTNLVPVASMPSSWWLQLPRNGQKLGKALALRVGGLPSGVRDRAFGRGDGMEQMTCGPMACESQLCHTRPGASAPLGVSILADGLEEGALTWFPQISPHEQRHRHRCAMNNLASAGGLEEGNKLSLAGLFKVSSQKQ